MFTMRKTWSFLVVAAGLAAFGLGTAQATITLNKNSDFTNNTLNGWGADQPGKATPTPAGVVMGTTYPVNGQGSDLEGCIYIAPASGTMTYVNSGLDMTFTQGNGSKGGGRTYLVMWNNQGGSNRRGYAITSSKDFSTIYLNQIRADGNFNQESIAAPQGFSTGTHSLALVAFDSGTTIAAYLDGVQLGSPLALESAYLPSGSPAEISVARNASGSDWYIPEGTVVSQALAFNFASGAFSATDLLAPTRWNGGAGNWNDPNQFSKYGSAATWSDGSDAVFGTASDSAGFVNISGTVKPNSISFNRTTGTYSLTGGTIDLNGANRRITVDRDMSAVIQSAITNGGLSKAGSGTLTLSAANTYAGDTNTVQGILVLNHSNAVANSTVNLSNFASTGGTTSAVTPGTLSFGGLTAATFGGLKGTQNLALTNASTQSVALTVGGNNQNTAYSGNLGDGAAVGGSLTKIGNGMLTLGGSNNSYTGGTTINGGTLALSSAASTNNIPNSSSINIAAGATLDVSRLSGGALVLTSSNGQRLLAKGLGPAYLAGSLSAGMSIIDMQDGANLGTLAISSGLYLSGGTLNFDLGSSGADEISSTAPASLGDTNYINVTNLSGFSISSPTTYNLITAASGLDTAGAFALSTTSFSAGGKTYKMTLINSGTAEQLRVAASGPSIWKAAVDGNWSDPNKWTGGEPNAMTAGALINSPTNVAVTITLDQPKTIGSLELGNLGSATLGYTISGTGANTLTLNNSTSAATIAVDDGAHIIDATVNLTNGLEVSGSGKLTFGASSSILGNGPLTMNGTGTLVLSGTGNYNGGTFVNAGILAATTSTALPDNQSLTVGAGGTLIFDPSYSASPVIASPVSSLAVSPVPEPGTLALLLAGLVVGFSVWRRGKKKL